jgi:hypothetical protein
MSILFNKNKYNYSIIKISYQKLKINYLFLNSKFIIYIPFNNMYSLKNKILIYNLTNFILNKKYIKSLFSFLNFSFLRNNNCLCVFINNNNNFIDIINVLEYKQFYYSYKSSFSNLNVNTNVLEEYNKYNVNYIYIQFILKKIKIKIIILLLFFLISIIKYI